MLKTHVLSAFLILCSSAAWADSHATEAAAESAGMAPGVDLAAAEQIFRKSCRACHGNRAQGASSYPSLSDKDPDYITEKLRIYRSGERIGPNSMLMIPQAKKLSDADIASLAIYVTTAFD